MTRLHLPFALFSLLVGIVPTASAAQPAGDEVERDDRIGLADLAVYRAALSGRATADEARPSDPPAHVSFRDLWDRPETYRGRRVTIRGRLERTFRQGSLGSFPPLAESWIFSSSGDPFCVVYPRAEPPGRDDSSRETRAPGPAPPAPGRMVRFTGTFLKTLRYAAGDGERLAPLIVGDRPPAVEAGDERTANVPGAARPPRVDAASDRDRRPDADRRSPMAGNQALGIALAAIVALVIAAQHIRGARLRRIVAGRRPRADDLPDPPLRFIDSPREDSP